MSLESTVEGLLYMSIPRLIQILIRRENVLPEDPEVEREVVPEVTPEVTHRDLSVIVSRD